MTSKYSEKAREMVWLASFFTAAMLVLTPVTLVSANASAQDVHELADICMFAQRSLKDYVLLGMGVTYHDPKKDLENNIKTVDKYIRDLESHHLKKSLDTEVKDLDARWKSIRAVLMKTPDKNVIGKLHTKIEEFTRLCEKAAMDVAEDTKIEGEQFVVLVAELGMESQRLAALYMMKAWDAEPADYYHRVESILEEYEVIYKELMSADEKFVSADIKQKLKTTEKHFMVFKFMAASRSGRFVPTRAEKSAAKIFEEIREILILEEDLVE